MRRFVEASGGPAAKRCKLRSLIETMEPRVLLSASIHPAAITSGGNPDYPLDTQINGTVYLDANNNGVIDAGDTAFGGQAVFVDQILLGHDTGTVDEQFSGTGVNPLSGLTAGAYTLRVLTTGTYRVRVIPQTSYAVETSSPGLQQDITINTLTATAENVDFIEVPQATIAGTVFNDANHNGIQDAGEAGVAGRTVWVDVNGNGVQDSDDLTAVTDASGHYVVLNVPPGRFNVHLASPAGSSITSPPAGQFSESFVSGQNITGVNFGTVGTDLSVALISPPPASAIGTYPTKQPAIVSVTNTGNFAINGLVGIQLYLSQDKVLDGTDFVIGSQLGKQTHLQPGQSKTFRIKFTVPAGVPTGTYHMIAQVLSSVSDSNPSNDIFVATATTAVSKPFIDMGVTYGSSQLDVKPGQATAVSVLLTNNGNVDFNGDYTLKVYSSAQPTLTPQVGVDTAQSDIVGKLVSIHLKLHPHQSKAIGVPIVFSGTDRQLSFLITTLETTDSLGDTNLSNNTAVSSLPSLLR